MKIGCGVTTYQRPDHIRLWNEQMKNHKPSATIPHEVYIASDSQVRMGIAYRKNECLRALKDCDYIFLFDDDCFPIKDYWADFFIKAHKASNQHHFLYLKETSTIKKTGSNFKVNIYGNCGGCFMFLTKEVIKKVGGYNKKYGYYGFEHAGYSHRIHYAGLTPMGMYLCPEGAGEFIYAMDYDFNLPFNRKLKHTMSLINEVNTISKYIEENHKVYVEDIKTVYQNL